MKKILGVILIMTLVLSCFSITTFAEDNGKKIDPELFALIGSDGGSIVRIEHSFESAESFFDAIEELTYYEAHSFSSDEIIVGLPYRSLSVIAALDNVKSISPIKYDIPEDVEPTDKYSKTLAAKLTELDPDANIHIAVSPAYSNYVYYGFTQDDFTNVDKYLETKRATAKEFFLSKNQEYLDRIKETVNISDAKLSNYSPGIWMTVAIRDVQKIAALNEVCGIDYISSEPNPSPASNVGFYFDKFAAWIRLKEFDPETSQNKYGTFSDYEELYYHTSRQGEAPDWVLIHSHVEFFNLTTEILCRRLGNRALVSWRSGASYPFELFIYNAQTDSFTEIKGANPVIGLSENNLDMYEGLSDAIDDLELGYQIGDADMNGEVDIIDVTFAQRILTGVMTQEQKYYLSAIEVIGDLDGDGFDMVDVTRLQRYVTRID